MMVLTDWHPRGDQADILGRGPGLFVMAPLSQIIGLSLQLGSNPILKMGHLLRTV